MGPDRRVGIARLNPSGPVPMESRRRGRRATMNPGRSVLPLETREPTPRLTRVDSGKATSGIQATQSPDLSPARFGSLSTGKLEWKYHAAGFRICLYRKDATA
jgi:hypothetical protein